MKKIIDRLEEAKLELISFSKDRSLVGSVMRALSNIEGSLAEIYSPHLYTPEQWETKTGETLKNSALVWTRCRGVDLHWIATALETALVLKDRDDILDIVVVNSPYPPPDDWMPEDHE
jgi:hypothetical protein